jgi:hypothetical protein
LLNHRWIWIWIINFVFYSIYTLLKRCHHITLIMKMYNSFINWKNVFTKMLKISRIGSRQQSLINLIYSKILFQIRFIHFFFSSYFFMEKAFCNGGICCSSSDPKLNELCYSSTGRPLILEIVNCSSENWDGSNGYYILLVTYWSTSSLLLIAVYVVTACLL